MVKIWARTTAFDPCRPIDEADHLLACDLNPGHILETMGDFGVWVLAKTLIYTEGEMSNMKIKGGQDLLSCRVKLVDICERSSSLFDFGFAFSFATLGFSFLFKVGG